MVKQTLPDNFYELFFLFGFMLMITERAWHLAVLYVDKSAHHSHDAQWKRYAFTTAGLINSVVVIVVLFSQYSLNQTYIGLNQMYDVAPPLGIAMWATLIVHVVTIPGMLGFMVWFYFHPVGVKW